MSNYAGCGCGYAQQSASYTSTSRQWVKSHCCNSFKTGQQCSDCPRR